MRDIWLCRPNGELYLEVEPLGLDATVWRTLYPRLHADPTHPVLQRLWQYHWGPEGDARLMPEECLRLRDEVRSVLTDPEVVATEETHRFFQDLACQIDKATELGYGIQFVAD